MKQKVQKAFSPMVFFSCGKEYNKMFNSLMNLLKKNLQRFHNL